MVFINSKNSNHILKVTVLKDNCALLKNEKEKNLSKINNLGNIIGNILVSGKLLFQIRI